MRLSAIALDYDGTTAFNDRLHFAVRDAITDVRSRGILVALVTGRRLADLRQVAGDLTCFDVVVAENGAVLEFPASGRHARLAHAPAPAFVDELSRRGVRFAAGEAIVEADAVDAPSILAVIRELELPLTLHFNRSRVMVLPQAVAKSTGLRQALRAFRISPHNALGIGDAENDHDLLDACEVGVAVEWGSASLRRVADEIVTGRDPSSVAAYISRVARQPRLSAAQMGRRRLFLGHEPDGTPLALAVRGRTILVAGEPGTGKSWLAGLLCEQLILQGYCLCVVDPEGDYGSLEGLPGVVSLGGDDPAPSPRELTRLLQHPDVSVVVDLSRLSHQDKVDYVTWLMPLLAERRRKTGLPHKILLDEAHYFLSNAEHTALVDPELAGYIVVTYRLSMLNPALRVPGETVALVTREHDAGEIDALTEMCRPRLAGAASAIFESLAMNEAALLPGVDEAHGAVRRFAIAPRLTSHVRHRAKYVDVPVGDRHAFVFGDDGEGPRVRTLKQLATFLETLPPDRLAGHVLRHDFSRWLREVFRDHPLATAVHALEDRLAAADDPGAIAQAIAAAIRARYEEPSGPA